MALKRVCKGILVVLDFSYNTAPSPFVIPVGLPARAGHTWARGWGCDAPRPWRPARSAPRCAPPAAARAQPSCAQLRIFHLILLLINGETQVQ